MRLRALLVALGLAVPFGGPASAGAPNGLIVWPARVRIAAGSAAQVHVRNRSGRPAAFSVGLAGLGLDLRGRPHVLLGSAGRTMLVVRPPRLVVAPGRTGTLEVRARRGLPGPGDHPALVLLTARSAGGAGIGVRVRIGVAVEVRVPGVVRRNLVLGALGVRRHVLEVRVANRGNVEERIARGDLVGQLWQRGRLVAVVSPAPQTLLPHGRAVVRFVVPGRVHGRVRIAMIASHLPARARSYVVAV